MPLVCKSLYEISLLGQYWICMKTDISYQGTTEELLNKNAAPAQGGFTAHNLNRNFLQNCTEKNRTENVG